MTTKQANKIIAAHKVLRELHDELSEWAPDIEQRTAKSRGRVIGVTDVAKGLLFEVLNYHSAYLDNSEAEAAIERLSS